MSAKDRAGAGGLTLVPGPFPDAAITLITEGHLYYDVTYLWDHLVALASRDCRGHITEHRLDAPPGLVLGLPPALSLAARQAPSQGRAGTEEESRDVL